MKKILVGLVLWMGLFSMASAQTREGDSSVGLGIGYAFDSEQAAISLDYRYSLTNALRINPELTYLVKKHGLSAWLIDVNAHYLVPLSGSFGFYPLAGLSFSAWNADGAGDWYGDKKTSDTITRIGANIGLGGEFYVTREFTVGLEVKYNIIKDLDQALLGVRVGYNF
ncbi:MAG: outer membrane beta-barrel protein [Parabacteroides sp.]